jgi:adenine deaminase
VQKAVEAGLTKDQAIRALTLDAAEILGAGDQLGSIEAGKIANLVVTSGDLLTREGRIRHVFIDGAEVELRRPDTQRGPGRPGRGNPPGDENQSPMTDETKPAGSSPNRRSQ